RLVTISGAGFQPAKSLLIFVAWLPGAAGSHESIRCQTWLPAAPGSHATLKTCPTSRHARLGYRLLSRNVRSQRPSAQREGARGSRSSTGRDSIGRVQPVFV